MCLSCGCHLPVSDHGDAANITLADLVAAALAADIPVGQAAENIMNTVREVTKMASTDQQPDPSPFDHQTHPRHAESGKFVPRGDVDQAMRRIHDGRQTSRTGLPKPVTPTHPASGS